MKKKGFTLIELLVVIAIIAMLLAILMPALNKVKKIAQRVVCATNLKGLGTAQIVYASDYEGDFALQGGGGNHDWDSITTAFQAPAAPWGPNTSKSITIGASLYLLVREADVSPKSFVCGAGGQNEYDGENTNTTDNPDLVELWDFGSLDPALLGPTSGPKNHVSYSYQMPYNDVGGPSKYAADETRSAAFAIMADKNPWFDSKLKEPDGTALSATNFAEYVSIIAPYWDTTLTFQKWQIQKANAYPHGREGQNVLYGDGHANYEKTADVGVKHDNIYTIQNATQVAAGGTDAEMGIRRGLGAGNYVWMDEALVQPTSNNDSLLVNDDDNAI